jgi:glycosyltransferase involved in cell wall biosynthesis
VIEPNDAAGLAEGIRTLLEQPDLAGRLGLAARETVLQRYGEAAVADAYERLLRSVTQVGQAEACT